MSNFGKWWENNLPELDIYNFPEDAMSAAYEAGRAQGLAEAAEIAQKEYDRILSCQSGKQNAIDKIIDQSIKTSAIMIPNIIDAIRAKGGDK